jgi:hypothetical protein
MHISLDQAIGRQPRLNRVGQSLLNIASGASAAYSLRSLTGGEPKAVRIRRDGDNEERDFTTAEIVNEAADWTNGKQETTLPTDVFTYESNFAFDVSGFATSDDATLTANVDGIGGRDNNLKITVGSASGARRIDLDNAFLVGGSNTLTMEVFIPSDNTKVDQVLVKDVGGVVTQTITNTDAWVSVNQTAIPTNAKLRVQLLDGGSGTITGGNGDVVYIREVKTKANAAAAYSLRKVKSDYTGDVVKVRRESDNAEKGFTASEISSGALVDFVNADGTQFMNFDGTDDDITTPALLPATDDFTLTITAFIESNPSSAMGIFGSAASGTGRHGLQLNTDGAVQFFAENLGGAAITTATIIEKSINTIVLTRTGQTFEISLNGGGAASRTGSSVVLTTGNNNIGDPYAGVNFQGVITSLSVASTTWDGTIANVPAGSTVNGSPSTNALNDGFVTIWYDQSGNSKNATQDVAANQPLIVENGSLLTDSNNQPIIDFLDDSVTGFNISNSISPDSIFSVVDITDMSGTQRIFERGGNNGILIASNQASFRFNNTTSRLVSSATGKQLLTGIDGSSGLTAKNGTEVTTSGITTSFFSGSDYKIGVLYFSGTTQAYKGHMYELIIYDSDQTNNRFKIESNINNHYGLYTAAQNGFVNTWYDQSSNSRNAVAAADANEPQIVENGNYLGELSFDGSNDTLSVATVSTLGIDGSNNKSAFAVARTTAGTDGFVIAGIDGGGSFRGLRYRSNATNGQARVEISSFGVQGGDLSDGNNHVYSSIFDGTQTQHFDVSLDGSITQGSGTDVVNTDGTSTFFIGTVTSNSDAGFTREFILYASDQTANRTAIETNIANEYGITLS